MSVDGTSRTALSPLRQALLTIERLEAELERRAHATHEPIAIRSAAMRLPGDVRDMESLADLLWRGVDATSEAPADRWDVDALHDARLDARGKIVTRRGAFVEDVAGFDASFFGISPREAIHIDPQQRLLLELAWEAIERAGIAPETLRGTRTGVFVGIGIGDWAVRMQRSGGLEDIDAYTGIGTGFAFAAGRIAFHLGLQGPTMAIDTACSSSLVALHLACQSLRAGECDFALVGGVHLMLAPETMVVLSRTGALAPDGRCKTFDARADGYGRGEGAAMVLLSRLADRSTADVPLLGVVRGSAVNHDGPSSALTVPNGPAQQAVIRRALSDANVAPHDIGYVEAHGTGTALGDPMEVGALAAVLGGERTTPLKLGSIKTNIGHLEAAAGLAGLLKLCLVLSRSEIPPHLHLRRKTPHVPWETLPIEVPTAITAWPEGRPRIGGVSAFGLSGTNAHAIIEAAPVEVAAAPSSDGSAELCVLSARTPTALTMLAERAAAHVEKSERAPLAQLAWSLTGCRSLLPYRLAVTASTHAELATRLRERALRDAGDVSTPAPVAFLFTGQGSPYPGMGRELYAAEPVFRATVDACERIAGSDVAVSPAAIIRGEIDSARLTDTALAQPAIYVLQCALASLWAHYGVTPDCVVGHSVGEIAAAWVAGAISLEDGMRFAIARGRAMGALPPGGAMVSVRADAARVETMLVGRSHEVSLAAANAPGQTVIAGVREAVNAVVRRLEAEGAVSVPLAVSHAFHSPLMEPALAAIGRAAPLATRPVVPFVSTLTGALLEEGPDATYWQRQARGAVRYVEAARAAWAHGARAFVEIGPRPTLLALTTASVPEARHLHPSLKPGTRERTAMRSSLAALIDLGVATTPAEAFDASARRYVAVPTYPFEHARFWVDPPSPDASAARVQAPSTEPSSHPLLGSPVRLASNETRFRARIEAEGLLSEHNIGGLPIVPLSAYVDASLRALSLAFGPGTYELTTLEVRQPLFVPADEPRELEFTVSPRGDALTSIAIRARSADTGDAFVEVATVTATRAASVSSVPLRDVTALQARCESPFPLDTLFSELAARGVTYGPRYRGITEAFRGDGELFARIEGADDATRLDLAVQAVGMAATDHARAGMLFPSAAGTCFVASDDAVAWVHATASAVPEGVVGTAELLAADGRVLARIEGLRLVRAEAHDVLRTRDARIAAWAHEVLFEPLAAPVRSPKSERWLVLTEGGPVGTSVRSALVGAEHAVALAFVGSGFLETKGAVFEIDPTDEPSYGRLIARAEAVLDGPLDGILHLWALRGDGPSSALAMCDSALCIARTLASAHGSPRLVLVTRGAQAVQGAAKLSIFQSPLWGIGRVLSVEQPELRTCLVDLDPDSLADHGADMTAALGTEDESQLAVRDGIVHGARLRAVGPETRRLLTTTQPWSLSKDATYVVTGGLGGLGEGLVAHLVARGAGRVAILSRSAPTPEAEARLATMRVHGADVTTHRCDVADAASLERALAAIADPKRPIRGIVHAAAVIDDALVSAQTTSRLRAVLAPKVEGTWNLHRAFADTKLDFFLCFSSLVSLMGSAGQANYAAANAFVDAIAAARRARGEPATTIQWGPWAGAGTAQTLADQRRWGELGLSKIPPSLGLRALEIAIGSSVANIAILPVAWPRFFARIPPDATPSLYKALRATHASPSSQSIARDHGVLTALANAGSEEARSAILLTYLQREAARILRVATPESIAPTRPLGEIGFDSLLAVELRNTVQQGLGVAIKVSVLFEHPTLLGLATHLAREEGTQAHVLRLAPVQASNAPSTANVDLSLIYFASGTSGPDDDKYRNVLSSARFADEAGFKAIWIPERHFFELGALYPDPSVLAAAIATVTRTIRLRAGSVVVPLHHPMHLAERWGMVDNLSGGRVDLSVATGWSPLDFVFAPEKYAERVQAMRDGTEALKQLWRGEAVALTSGTGERVSLRSFPRPVQPELPIWFTCSGGIERFVEAGAAGANVLTALLFQTYEQLGDKITAYRRARKDAGHDPATGVVTLMLHTYVDPDEDAVIPAIRAPFLSYLESSAKAWLGASDAETVRNVEQMSAEERADVLEMAFTRYVHTAGLFGTPEMCRERLRALATLGVNEVACLIDFGVDAERVAASLTHLAKLMHHDGASDLVELVL